MQGNGARGKPPVPFGLKSLRIVSASTKEMTAWVRYSGSSKPEDKTVKVDIDLCDPQGNVCVQMRRLASRVLDADVKFAPPSITSHRIPIKSNHPIEASGTPFDEVFYRSLIADVVNCTMSVEEAAELE
jgi:hypothetical protein